MHHWDLNTMSLSGVNAPLRNVTLHICQVSMHHGDLNTVSLSGANAPLRSKHCELVRCQCTTKTPTLYICQVSMHHWDLSTVHLSGVNAPPRPKHCTFVRCQCTTDLFLLVLSILQCVDEPGKLSIRVSGVEIQPPETDVHLNNNKKLN